MSSSNDYEFSASEEVKTWRLLFTQESANKNQSKDLSIVSDLTLLFFHLWRNQFLQISTKVTRMPKIRDTLIDRYLQNKFNDLPPMRTKWELV